MAVYVQQLLLDAIITIHSHIANDQWSFNLAPKFRLTIHLDWLYCLPPYAALTRITRCNG